jgi:ABC-type sugar transport system permease subunit
MGYNRTELFQSRHMIDIPKTDSGVTKRNAKSTIWPTMLSFAASMTGGGIAGLILGISEDQRLEGILIGLTCGGIPGLVPAIVTFFVCRRVFTRGVIGLLTSLALAWGWITGALWMHLASAGMHV